MLSVNMAVLIDLGAMVHYGDELKECTKKYSLDVATGRDDEGGGGSYKYPQWAKGCLKLDLVCTASTITELVSGSVNHSMDLVSLEVRVGKHVKEEGHHIGWDFANLCLTSEDLDFICDSATKLATSKGLVIQNY